MTSRTRPLALAALLLAAVPASAQTLPLEVEVGYRWLDVSGNEDMYRSQVNERSGFVLRSLLVSDDGSRKTKLYDRFRLDVGDLGRSPAGAARLSMGRAGVYDFSVAYRRAELFSALPAFANPLLGAGVVPGQHTSDRVRHMLDAELRLLPGRAIRPILGYGWNRASGPGTTTYTIGGDEFRLAQDRATTEHEFRIGAEFDAGPVSGVVTQAWRKIKETDTTTLAPGAGGGNSAGTVLGVPVSLTDFHRTSRMEGTIPVTNAAVTGRLGSRLRLVGTFARSSSTIDDSFESESLSGSLVSFRLRSVFDGLTETVSSRAENEMWTAGGRVEASLLPGLDATASFSKRHRDLDGTAVVSSLFLGAVSFGGVTARDVEELLTVRSAVERDELTVDLRLNAKMLGPLSLTAGVAQRDQDLTVSPDAAQIVVPGGQGGFFERRVRTWDVGANLAVAGFRLGGDIRRERADVPIVRVDFVERSRYRLRAGWTAAWVSVSATGEQTDADNDWPGVDLDSRLRQFSGEIAVNPVKAVRARFAAGAFRTEITSLYRRPHDFGVDVGRHLERGKFYEYGLTFTHKVFSLDASYTTFDNRGTLPFEIDRGRFGAEGAFSERITLGAEFATDRYREGTTRTFGDFEATRFGLYLRYRQ